MILAGLVEPMNHKCSYLESFTGQLLTLKGLKDFSVKVIEGYSHSLIRIKSKNPIGQTKLKNIQMELSELTKERAHLRMLSSGIAEISVKSLDSKRLALDPSLKIDRDQIYVGKDEYGSDIYLSLSRCGNVFYYDKQGLLLDSIVRQNDMRARDEKLAIKILCDNDKFCYYKDIEYISALDIINNKDSIQKDLDLLYVDIDSFNLYSINELKDTLVEIMQGCGEEGLVVVLHSSIFYFLKYPLLDFCQTRVIGKTRTPMQSCSILGSADSYYLYTDSEVCVSSKEFDSVVCVELPVEKEMIAENMATI